MSVDFSYLLASASPFIDFIINNSIISALIAATIIGLIGYIKRKVKDRRDMNKVYNYLVYSSRSTPYKFRSTQAISAKTKIPVSRIEYLCCKHECIQRNQKEKESWRAVS